MMAKASVPIGGCAECAKRDRQIAELHARLAHIEAELARAKKNSSNSSKPPSSDIVKPPKQADKGRGRRQKRRRGGQPGHPRHQRSLLKEGDLDAIWEWRYPACPCCGGKLKDTPDLPKRFQQIELGDQPLRKEEHRAVIQQCVKCHKVHIPRWPAYLAKAGLFGPRLLALVGWFKGVCHMSFSAIRKYFRDVMKIPVSRGFLAKAIQKVSQSLKDPYEALLELVREEPRLNVDETSHPEYGRRMWTWCFRASLYTVFKVSPSRGSNVLLEVLGQDFHGVLGCDYFSAYHKYMRLNENVLLQFCLAHFIRDVKFLVQHPDPRNRDYGQRVLALLKKLFGVIHRREEYASAASFQKTLVAVRNALAWEVTMEAVDTRESENLATRFFEHFDDYFRFITTPGIEPTNNLAERAIRFVAIHRRMTQGTRGERGRQWWERICTAVVTCEQQGRSLWSFLCESIAALIGDKAAPSLIVPSVNSS